jgi:hypothetical protein
MKRKLKNLFFIFIALSIIAGFFVEHEHVYFFWHKVPCFEAFLGALGAILLVSIVKLFGRFIRRREDFYD